MAWVYILRGASRYYIGATDNLERRTAEHKRGSNHTTHRVRRPYRTCCGEGTPINGRSTQARADSKTKKESATRNHDLAVRQLTEQPRRLSGLVPGSSPGRPKEFPPNGSVFIRADSWLKSRANRAANFVVDLIETPTNQLRWLLPSRVADHRQHEGSRPVSDR
jgi:predicted GIY-YIG superfamily endonuclease